MAAFQARVVSCQVSWRGRTRFTEPGKVMMRTVIPGLRLALLASPFVLLTACDAPAADRGPVGYWKLSGDCKDHSGHGHHGTNHGVDLDTGAFDGRGSHVEVPDAPALRFGKGAFSVSLWVHTEAGLDDVLGDVLAKFDAGRRKVFTLTLGASAAGYNST